MTTTYYYGQTGASALYDVAGDATFQIGSLVNTADVILTTDGSGNIVNQTKTALGLYDAISSVVAGTGEDLVSTSTAPSLVFKKVNGGTGIDVTTDGDGNLSVAVDGTIPALVTLTQTTTSTTPSTTWTGTAIPALTSDQIAYVSARVYSVDVDGAAANETRIWKLKGAFRFGDANPLGQTIELVGTDAPGRTVQFVFTANAPLIEVTAEGTNSIEWTAEYTISAIDHS